MATVLCCFVQALIKRFPCEIMHPLTDFLDCLLPNPRQQVCKVVHLEESAIQTDTEPDPLFKFFRSCASGRDIFEHSFMVATMLPSLSSILVSPLATTPGVGAGLAPSSPKALTTSFTWRGSASIQSPRELHRTVLLRIWSCLSRSDHLRRTSL